MASRLTRERGARLHRAIQEVLIESIETGGSSVSDYVDSDGRRGSFQLRLRHVKGRSVLVWQGNNQANFDANLEILKKSTGLPPERVSGRG